MRNAFHAGIVYFLIVFAAGFVLGTARVVVINPLVGEVAAVLLELPIILFVSWMLARWLVVRFGVPRELAARCLMGFVAFVLLMLAETALGYLLFNRSISEQIVALGTFAGMIGPSGQVAFGLMPLFVGRRAT